MSTKLQAYKNDPALRKAFLAEMRKHQKLDQIVQGTYGKGSNGDFRGCAIGCSIHSLMKIEGKKLDTSRHQLLQDYLDIPVEIAYLFDALFERLPIEDAKLFPLRCAKAIRCGADLSLVIPRFLYWLMVDPKDGVIRFVQEDRFKQQRDAILGVAKLHKQTIEGSKPSAAAWAAARETAGAARETAGAAWAAAVAARETAAAARETAGAAWEAARETAAAARATTRATTRAARAAWEAVGEAAWAAAWEAVGDAAVKRMAEKLIELLGAA